MKKILIINNYTNKIQDLEVLFEDIKYDLIDLREFDFKKHEKKYDAFILSGGSAYSILENASVYSQVIKLIEATHKPILGISLGFELIGYAYNEELVKAVGFGSGIRQIKVKEKEDILFNDVDSYFVAAEAHKWYFEGLRHLKILASSQRGIEIARHPQKPIYGIQFHPEIDIGDKNPKKIIDNFINLI